MLAIETLTSATAAQWNAALDGAPPAPAEIGRVAARLAKGPLAPELRLIAADATGPIARFAAQQRAKSIRLWLPEFRGGVAAESRARAMDGFVAALLEARRAAGLMHLPLETEPGDDQPDFDLWIAALRGADFTEDCAYRLHVLPRANFAGPRHAIPGLVILSIEPDALRTVAPILRLAYAETLERRQSGFEGAQAHVHHLGQTGRGYTPGLWLMAEYRGAPAAAIVVNLAEEPPFPGLSAWVLEIGCLPAYRRQGFAAALLAEALARLAKTECRQLLATIDERNAPSIRLHDRFGFERSPGRFYLYRRAG